MSHFYTLCFLSLLLTGSYSIPDSELRSLLEFRKSIKESPSNKPISWPHTTNTLSNPKKCPDATWTGITCDPESGSITGINLNNLGLSGDLKFHTLLTLTSLRTLSLSGNTFTGRLVPQLGSLKALNLLDLSSNEFYGPIPSKISELYGLRYLNLSSNKFQGGLSLGFREMQQLRVLDLHSNELEGDVGEIMSELRNVEFVDLSFNRLYGGLGGLGVESVESVANTLHHLNLSYNGLSGGFFSEGVVGLFKNLEVVDLEGNGISSELLGFGLVKSLKVLKLGGNRLFGHVPKELLQGSVQLQELDLSRNGFTGSLREINSTSLNVLNLSFNGLSGELPSTLKRCLVIDLSWNMFSGDVSVVQKWEATPEFVDLSSNNLSGVLPNFTSSFARLSVLNIRNNSLGGALPSLWDKSGVSQLSVVDLSLNRFVGLIPSSFFTITSLSSLNLSMNNLTGPIPFRSSHASELLVIHYYPQMELLDLSTNSLTGMLPGDIGTMGRLNILNLSNNKLSGELPSDLNKLSDLEYLDLSKNGFDGQIPDKLPSHMTGFNVSFNNLSGTVPKTLRGYPHSSFFPGNSKLNLPGVKSVPNNLFSPKRNHSHRRIIIIVASFGAALMVLVVLFAIYRIKHGRSGFTDQASPRDVKMGRSSRPSFLNFSSNAQNPSSSLSFSNDHLLTPNSKSLSGQHEFATEISEHRLSVGEIVSSAATSSAGPSSSSPRFSDQPVVLDVDSPDRLAGELFFLDTSLKFTVDELSRAPAEVLGRSSNGTLYKATLDNGHMLKVKWLRVGLVRHKKDFAKEVKKIGSLKHQDIVPLRAYYSGPREQERLLLSDYIRGDNLALHLYETSPRRNTRMSFTQRLKVAVDVAKCLLYLHDRATPHGNLKPTNIILTGSDNTVKLTDYCIHRLMTQAGVEEQTLTMSALGYCAPELASEAKPMPTLKSDVYTFGVILMELLTRRSAGDIISGQPGAVDLTDWVRLCDHEGRRMDCIDRDIAGRGETSKAMEEMLGVSLRCIVPVNERPNIRQVLDDLSSTLSS